jgi:PhzF family phenazine biosynthesis protein
MRARMLRMNMTITPGPEVLRYTAFSDDPSGGNPAGVVLDASGLGDAEMLAVAARVGYSETAFLTPPPPDLGARGRAFTVRYFSPLAEVPFCGHATVATAVALAERIGAGPLLFATPVGTVPVEVAADDEGTLLATLTSVPPSIDEIAPDDVEQALSLLGWKADELDVSLPPRIAYAGARHLVLAVAERARLAELHYDFEGLARFMRDRDLTTLQLVWRQSPTTFHVRDPFPVGGVVEDPATGAAAAAFGHYLRALGQVNPAARITLHQGEDLGRPGVLTIDLRPGDARVRVTGAAVAISESEGA